MQMKKFTHLWQLLGCLFFLLVSFDGQAKVRLMSADIGAKPVVWQLTGKVTTSAGDPLPGVTV